MSYRTVNSIRSNSPVAASRRALAKATARVPGNFGAGRMDGTSVPVIQSNRAPSPKPARSAPAVGYAGRSRKIPATSSPLQPKPAALKRPQRVTTPKPEGAGRGARTVVSHPTRGGSYISRSQGRGTLRGPGGLGAN